jgi:hypothetical protein
VATTADRALEPKEWRALAILGLPTFALALAITTLASIPLVRRLRDDVD